MAGVAEAQLDVLVEIKEALANLGELQKQAKESESALSKSFSAIKGAAVGLIAVFGAKQIGDFFGAGIESAIAQEKAIASLSQQLKLTGEFSDDAVAGFAAFADEMERTTTFGDDVVISQLAVAKSFGASNEQAETLVKAATELSAVTGDDLSSSVQKLGKTLQGSAGALSKTIGGFDQLTKKELEAGKGLEFVLDRFGGSQAAQIATFSGALTQTGNAFGNLQEEFGALIVDNPQVVAAIQLVGTIFTEIQAAVHGSSGGLGSFVGLMAEGFAVSVSVATEITTHLVEALQLLIEYGAPVFSVMLDAATFFAKGWLELQRRNIDAFLTFVETVVRAVDDIPILGEALKEIGVDFDETADTIGDLRKGFDGLVDDGVKSLNDIKDGAIDFSVSAHTALGNVVTGLKGIQRAVDDGAQKVFDADRKVIKSSKEVAAARKAIADQEKLSAKEREKAIKELDEFEKKIRGEAASAYEKILLDEQDQLKKIEEFKTLGVLEEQKAADLRVIINQGANDKIEKLLQEGADKQAATAKEAAEKTRAEWEKAVASPIEFLIKSNLPDSMKPPAGAEGNDPGTEEGRQAVVVASAIGKAGATLLQGAQGAKTAVVEGTALAIDAFAGPGVGQALKPFIDALTMGPDQAKVMVREFVDAVPGFITAIAEAFPVVVEVLVDSLINKGGLIRIAVALLRALAGEAILKAIGKQIGLEFGRSFNGGPLMESAAEFGATASDAMKLGLDGVSDTLSDGFGSAVAGASQLTSEAIRDAFQDGSRAILVDGPKKLAQAAFVDLPTKIREGFTSGLVAFADAFQQLPQVILEFYTVTVPGALTEVFNAFMTQITQTIPEAFQAGADAIRGVFSAGATSLRTAVTAGIAAASAAGREALSNAAKAVSESIGDFIDGVQESLGGFLSPIQKAFQSFGDSVDLLTTTPDWVDDLIGGFDAVTGAIDSLGGTFGWFLDNMFTLFNFLPEALADIFSFGGGGGGLISGSGTPLDALASGITEVPSGYPNDTYGAMLTSGERVVDARANQDLKSMLADYKNGRLSIAGGGATDAMLMQIIELLSRPVYTEAQIKIDNATFADLMLKQDRRNARTRKAS